MNKNQNHKEQKTFFLAEKGSEIFLARKSNGELLFAKEDITIKLESSRFSESINDVLYSNKDFTKKDLKNWNTVVNIIQETGFLLVNGYSINNISKTKTEVELNIQYKPEKEDDLILMYIKDISQRNQTEYENINQEKTVNAIYSTFQKTMLDGDFIGNMNRGLDSVADLLNISKVTIYLYYEETNSYKSKYIYKNRKFSRKKDGTKEIITSEEFEPITSKFKNNTPILIDTGCPFVFKEFNDDFQKQLVCYFLPLTKDNKLMGIIKIDEYRNADFEFTDRTDQYRVYNAIINNSFNLLKKTFFLSKNYRNFQQMSNSINDVFFLYDIKKQRYVFISPHCNKILGRKQSEFYDNLQIQDIIYEGDKELFNIMTESLKVKKFVDFVFRILQPNGTFKYIQNKVYSLENEHNELTEISGLCLDITKKINKEKIIKESYEIIYKKNKELIQKNEQINKLLKIRDTDLYLKTVNLSNTKNLLYKTKNEIEELIEKDGNGSNRLAKISKNIDQITNDKHKLWQEIQTEYEKIRPNFFKNIVENHKEISANDLKHCYYVTNSLSSHEVANLLNISVRSVETARYRLKKKLKIKAKESLLSYLNKF